MKHKIATFTLTKKEKTMGRKIKLILLLAFSTVFFASCGPKPYYKTSEGKKKWKHYNSIQYDRENQKSSRKRRN